jgi:ABC-type transport system involved in multi-copper enzyme maturation permease subunit
MLGLPAFVLWFLALLLGCGIFAGERANGTESFQDERPVARATIWNAKLLFPILALVAAELLYIVTVGKLYVPAAWHNRLYGVPLMFLVMGFLCFASAVFCSVILSRPVTAWAAAAVLWIVSALLLQAPIDHWFDNGISLERTGPWLIWLTVLAVEAISLLWLSRLLYVRTEKGRQA